MRISKPLIVISSTLLVSGALAFLYWFSAWRAAHKLESAVFHRNIAAVDSSFDWPRILSSLSDSIPASFGDPNAMRIGKIVQTSFKQYYLGSVMQDGWAKARVASSGFTKLNQYRLVMTTGTTYKLSREGLEWRVTTIMPTHRQAKRIGVHLLMWIHHQSSINLHDGALYFDNPRYGARLTSVSQRVMTFAVSTSIEPWKVAYVVQSPPRRNCLQRNGFADPCSTIWRFNMVTLKGSLLYDEQGIARKHPDLSQTRRQYTVAFSPNGRTLYFESPGGATSDEIWAIPIHTHEPHAVMYGSGLRVIRHGAFTAGDLLVNQHRYWVAPDFGSYNPWVLARPDGKRLAMCRCSLKSAKKWLPRLYDRLPSCTPGILKYIPACRVKR